MGIETIYSSKEKKLKIATIGAEVSIIVGVVFLVIGILSFICYMAIMIAGPEGSLYWPIRPGGFFAALSTLLGLSIFFIPSGLLATLGNLLILQRRYRIGGIMSMASSIHLTILVIIYPPMFLFMLIGALPLICGILSLTLS
ncbi:MAG: hypothetical protein AOA65_0603 [Candidatus Bathyarchaeota archaeon BA1]|nr:MAG: hypothetical protein AOA65_0603 [Candidatus Bathyarchaeota archaeon BA1]